MKFKIYIVHKRIFVVHLECAVFRVPGSSVGSRLQITGRRLFYQPTICSQCTLNHVTISWLIVNTSVHVCIYNMLNTVPACICCMMNTVPACIYCMLNTVPACNCCILNSVPACICCILNTVPAYSVFAA